MPVTSGAPLTLPETILMDLNTGDSLNYKGGDSVAGNDRSYISRYDGFMPAIARMLDANANRAREALRVMEDAARFALDDAALSGDIKSLRHDLRAALDLLPRGWLEANRNTLEDVGTSISTPAELQRDGLIGVVIAAGKRLSESLRVIEELSKTINDELAQQIQSLRYRAYSVESQLQLRLGSGRARQWKLCVLLTQTLCNRPWNEVLRAAIDGGADCIQVREKDLDGGALVKHVRDVIAIARPSGASVIVNDRVDAALAANADGVHLGQHDLPIHDARRIAGRSLLIGASTHDLDEAAAAVRAGADYCGVGTMFASSLKPDREPSGPKYLQTFIKRHPRMPHLAIGGITAENVHEVVAAGARGVAVSSALCGADDPHAIAVSLCEAIDHAALGTARADSKR